MARLSKEDWLKKGLQVLTTKGYTSLRLEYLCEQLEVTRGSFYHHFKDMDDYVEKLMQYWEENSNSIMKQAELHEGTPLEKLNKLQEGVFKISARLEVVIRAWATFNKTVLKYTRKIDRKRISFVAELYEAHGMSKEVAEITSKIEYATYIGVQNLYFVESKKEAESLYREFEHVMIRFGKSHLASKSPKS